MTGRPLLTAALAFLLTAAAPVAAEGPHYFVAVENGGYNFPGGEKQMAESFKVLEAMVKLAEAQNVRLTLLFSAQYAVYIATDPSRLAELKVWKDAGNEVGAYHVGPWAKGWDGYSDLPARRLARLPGSSSVPGPASGHAAYLAALNKLELNLKTGCMEAADGDRKFLAAAPPYDICRYRAEPPGAAPGTQGGNSFIGAAAGGREKFLSVFHPVEKSGVEDAAKVFAARPDGVYGAVFRSAPSEFGAFYAWLGFLRKQDPRGGRSRTVNTAMNSGLLAERALPRPAPPAEKADKKVRLPRPKPIPQPDQTRAEIRIPRLQPVPSFFGSAERIPSSRHRIIPYGNMGSSFLGNINRMIFGVYPKRRAARLGLCGDGVCDVFERSHPGTCPRDCGR